MKFQKSDLYTVLEMAMVFAVALSMTVYGLGKYVQFGNGTLPDKLVSELTGMELMWSFYGYSKTYPIIIGVAEVLGAILLTYRPTRVIGGLLLTAILSNIIMQDIIYGVHVGALKAAIFYQIMVGIILWINRRPLIDAFKAVLLHSKAARPLAHKALFILAAFALAFLLKYLEVFVF